MIASSPWFASTRWGWLAVTALAQSGAAGVEDALSQQVINEQIAQEQIQGTLHTRIIEQQLPTGD